MLSERNKQLKRYQNSRNKLTEHHRLCAERRTSIKLMEDGYLTKSDKEAVLGRIRELDNLTGFKYGNYNRK